MSSRIAHHVDFPDYNESELLEITKLMADSMHYNLDKSAFNAMKEYIQKRKQQAHFANARSIRNALDCGKRIAYLMMPLCIKKTRRQQIYP